MQSAAVYSRTAARSIASNISNECSSKCSTSVSKHSTITTKTNILSDRLLNRFYSNLRYLSQGLSILTKSSSNIHSSTFLTSPITQTKRITYRNPSVLIDACATTSIPTVTNINNNDKLRLVTAYSGYSKEFNFLNNNNCSSSKYGIQLLNRKKGQIGDDAWFIASQKCADVMGVADGVGGWWDVGVDPSKFSSNLMRTCKRLVEQELGSTLFSNSKNINKKTPIEILSSSYQALLENKNQCVIGSSTACIIVFNRESNCLHSANLGDSGFVVIRQNKIVHRSQEQTHYFNSPFQMAILPNVRASFLVEQNYDEIIQEQNNNNNNNNQNIDTSSLINDSPDMASVSSFDLREGDFIVIATDGLWDNLNENALLIEISKIKVSFILEKIF